jgi:predicted dehydrogenase
LADPEVDAVVISTPPQSHTQILEDCLKHGKHVLLEKPLTIKPEEIDKLRSLYQQYSSLTLLAANSRHSRLIPKYQKAKEIVDSGKLGEIYLVRHHAVVRKGRPGVEYHPEAKWFLDKSIAGGGPVLDWGVYDLSFHLGVLGIELTNSEVSIKAKLLKNGLDDEALKSEPVFDVEEHGMIWLKINELDYLWERASHANMEEPNVTRIYGTRGGLKLSYCSWDDINFTQYGLSGAEATENNIVIDASGHDDNLALAHHFINVLKGSEKPVLSFEEALRQNELLLEILE